MDVRSSGCEGSARKILVIDADETVGQMIADCFAADEFVVDTCTSTDLIYDVNFTDYALVLLDLGIDTADTSYGIMERIKQTYPDGRVSIIAYSVCMSPENIIRALNVGADDYLIKPFSLRELKARVRSVLRRR